MRRELPTTLKASPLNNRAVLAPPVTSDATATTLKGSPIALMGHPFRVLSPAAFYPQVLRTLRLLIGRRLQRLAAVLTGRVTSFEGVEPSATLFCMPRNFMGYTPNFHGIYAKFSWGLRSEKKAYRLRFNSLEN